MAGNQLLLINPPKKTGGKKMASRSKASRSAAAKKAAATRKRNAAKRSAAAKKAAATRKRNASKGKRKATRSTKASRSAAAKKAAATRKRNANKRKAAAKKAAATRKRNAKRKGRGSVKSKSRPTAAKRRAAARKAAATRKRNANKRSRAAKKAAATRRRNAGKRKGRRKGSRKARNVGVATQGKSLYDAFMKGTDMLVPGLLTVASVAVGLGIYRAVQNVAWDALNITGSDGYIQQAADMVPLITPNMSADLGNFGNKALHVGSVAALGYLLSSKKALNLVDAKLTKSVTGILGIFYSGMLLSELQTYSLGTVFRNFAMGDFAGAINAFGSGAQPSMTYGLGMAHGNVGMMHGGHNNMGMYHVGGAHNMGSVVNKKFFGAHNGGMLLPQNVSAPTAATQNTAGMGKAFFGTRGRGLGSSRVNLF